MEANSIFYTVQNMKRLKVSKFGIMQNKDMLIFEVHSEDNSIFYMLQNMGIWIV